MSQEPVEEPTPSEPALEVPARRRRDGDGDDDDGGSRKRLLVVLKWGWSYLTFARGSRLIQSQSWRSYSEPPRADSEPPLVTGTWAAPALPGASHHRHVDEEARA